MSEWTPAVCDPFVFSEDLGSDSVQGLLVPRKDDHKGPIPVSPFSTLNRSYPSRLSFPRSWSVGHDVSSNRWLRTPWTPPPSRLLSL